MYIASARSSPRSSRCVACGARRSESSENGASLTVELEPNADVQIARLAILERLELLRPDFPPGVSRPAVSNYVPSELSEQPLLMLTVTGPYTAGALQKLADEQIEPRLSAVPGVGVHLRPGRDRARGLRLLRSEHPPAARHLPQVIADALGTRARGAGPGQGRSREHRAAGRRSRPAGRDGGPRQPAGHRARRARVHAGRPRRRAPRGGCPRGSSSGSTGSRRSRCGSRGWPGADAIKTAAAVRAAVDELEPRLPPAVQPRDRRTTTAWSWPSS